MKWVKANEQMPINGKFTYFVKYGPSNAKGTLHVDNFDKWGVTEWLDENVDENVEKLAEKYADSKSYQSDKEQFTVTPWTQWNLCKKSFIEGYAARNDNEAIAFAEHLVDSGIVDFVSSVGFKKYYEEWKKFN